MNEAVVIYKSKYGASKRYAEWIASDLNAPLFDSAQISAEALGNYSVIVFGGGMYAGKINGIKLILKNPGILQNKKIVIFICGLTDPNNEKATGKIKKTLFEEIPPKMKGNVKLFHLSGGITYSKLKFMDFLIMKMVEKAVKLKKAEKYTPEERKMAETVGKDFDFVDREKIKPIVAYVKSLG